MRDGRYTFFFHYRKQDGRMSVHYRKQCYPCDDIVCLVPCSSKRNRRQPRLVMRGICRSVYMIDKVAVISDKFPEQVP